METQIQIKIMGEDKELIKKAAKELTVGHSTFCRIAALEKAKNILSELKEDSE